MRRLLLTLHFFKVMERDWIMSGRRLDPENGRTRQEEKKIAKPKRTPKPKTYFGRFGHRKG